MEIKLITDKRTTYATAINLTRNEKKYKFNELTIYDKNIIIDFGKLALNCENTENGWYIMDYDNKPAEKILALWIGAEQIIGGIEK